MRKKQIIDGLCHAEAEIPIFELIPLFGEQAQHFQDFQMLYCLILTTTLMEFNINEKTSPKGFSASKCDVGNWIFSKS